MTPEQRDAGIRADIAAGVLSDGAIARKYGVHRSSIYRKRVPRPTRGRRTFTPTVRPLEPVPPEAPTVPNVGVGGISPELRKRLDGYRQLLLRQREQAAPEPVLPPAPKRHHVNLTNQQCARVCKDLEDLGWRAETIPMGDNTSAVEVRSLAVRHTPVVAVLRTTREVLRFEGVNERCPSRGRQTGKLPYGKQPWSKNQRRKDEPITWPPTYEMPHSKYGTDHRSDIDW